MKPFDFSVAKQGPHGIYLDSPDGVAIEIVGSQERIEQGIRFASEFIDVVPSAIEMLTLHLRGEKSYSLYTIEFYAERTGENGDFVLSFSRDDDPRYENTSYSVFFFMNEEAPAGMQKYHPFKVSVEYG